MNSLFNTYTGLFVFAVIAIYCVYIADKQKKKSRPIKEVEYFEWALKEGNIESIKYRLRGYRLKLGRTFVSPERELAIKRRLAELGIPDLH